MKIFKFIVIIFIYCIHSSCEDFVEVDVPDHKIVSETVFSNDESANSAVVGIYNELFNAEFSNGGFNSISLLSGFSADNLQNIHVNTSMEEFEENEILVDNGYNLALWSSAYNIIYMCNAVINGLEEYKAVNEDMREKLTGEVRFVRAFVNFYLVNLYGAVPVIQTTDYRENSLIIRRAVEEVYDAIISDLKIASVNLGESYDDLGRIRPNRYTAKALLARVYLYLEDWENAEFFSSKVINNTKEYQLLQDLDNVFLANSKEAIWQISPDNNGEGAINPLTDVGGMFILNLPHPNSQKPATLTPDFIKLFSENDSRPTHWIGLLSVDNVDYYYPYKYKANSLEVTSSISEYSMVMRLAEQYLIRAEARLQLGKMKDAIIDLDIIRRRAKLNLISSTKTRYTKEELQDSIQLERQRELFSEWGHRWLDLKRTGQASETLGTRKSLWNGTDVFYPIPEEERRKNPYLTQNTGY